MRASAAGRVAWNGASADYQISEQTREVAVTSAMDFESEGWQAWLERIPSFAFHGRDGQRFTARKETRARGGSYWVAYRKFGGKLTHTYIGRTADVTLSRLEEVGRSFATGARSPVRLHQRSPEFQPRTAAETQWQDQLLSTKFFVPLASHSLIARPRLFALLDEGRQRVLTLLSAPAGFGKTTLLSAWIRSLPSENPLVAWVSLDGADNHPVRFWISVLAALDWIQPGLCSEFVTYLLMEPNPPLYYVLTACLNALAQALPSLVIVLDDYHVITEEAVHTSLTWFLEHLPSQISLILSTRADPPLPLTRFRGRGQLLEVRANELRATSEEVRDFLSEVMHVELTERELALVDERTEGWLAGLQLVGLSLQGQHASGMYADLLEMVSGQQGYILDYLTEEVLRRQSESIQIFLLRTSILDGLTAPLCDVIMQQQGSQQMLETLERANLFVVALDRQRRWYRYHALFAEALRYRLEQREGEAIRDLHLRASQWYAGQGDIFEAVRHALEAQAWLPVADLIERFDYTLVWRNERAMFLRWVEMLPPELLRSRPRLCLIYAHALLFVASPGTIENWLQIAETVLTDSLVGQANRDGGAGSQSIEELHNVLGAILAFRAFIASVYGDAYAALLLCQRALDHLSEQNIEVQAEVAVAEHMAYFSLGEFVPAIQKALEANTLFEAEGIVSQSIYMLNSAAYCLIRCGHLHEAWELLEQASAVGSRAGGFPVPSIGVILAQQAEILREWNQLDAALDFVRRAIQLIDQIDAAVDLVAAYCTLVSISLARGEHDGVSSALKQVERVEQALRNSFIYTNYIPITRVRNWLARGELEQAVHWSQEQRETGRYTSPLAQEREAVALARVWLARNEAEEALSHLGPFLEAATRQDRWGNVIELLLLTALAHRQRHEEQEALAALTEAVRLAEPEGYMRMFVDEGAPMAALLSTLRVRRKPGKPGKDAMAGYLDRVLAAFPPQSKIDQRALQQPLPEPLSAREQEVLSLLARGASNQEIAETLVVALDTVKRHVSNILSKLAVSNRTQAVVRARALGLLSEEV